MRLFFLFLFAGLSLFGNPFDPDPTFIVENCVNPLNGEYFVLDHTLILEGEAPLTLTRSYSSFTNKWEFNPHTELILKGEKIKEEKKKKKKSDRVESCLYLLATHKEPNGKTLTYHLGENNEYTLLIPKETINTAKRPPSALNSPHNQFLTQLNQFTFKVITPAKVERYYVKSHTVELDLYFLLQKEVYPNGYTHHYIYDQKHNLTKIQIENPHEEISGECRFSYPTKGKWVITSSQGKELTYTFHKDTLVAVEGTSCPNETLEYLSGRLYKRTIEGRDTHLIEYTPDEKVQCLKNGEGTILYTFSYLPNQTEVYDTHHLLTRYSFNDHPKKIERFNRDTQLLQEISFEWNTRGELIKQTESSPPLQRIYSYDHKGNLTEERVDDLILTKIYDEEDRLIAQIYFSNEGEVFYEESWEYDGTVITSYIDPEGLKTTFAYNSLKQKEKETIYTRQGPVETVYTYNTWGKVETARTEDLLTRYHYTHQGELVWVTEEALSGTIICKYPYSPPPPLFPPLPQGKGVYHSLDPFGRVTSVFTQDRTVHYTLEYNKRGQVTKITDQVLQVTGHRRYDDVGNLIDETLLNGLRLKSKYDKKKRKTSLILPDQSSIRYKYGLKYLNEIQRFDSKENLKYSHKFLSYDLFGTPLVQIMIDGLGKITTKTSPEGKLLSLSSPYFTQTLEDLDQQEFPILPLPYTYKLDGLNRITEIKQPNRVIKFTYDLWNRRLSKTILEYVEGDWVETEHLLTLYDAQEEIGAFEKGKCQQLRLLTPNRNQTVALELEELLYAPIHDLQGNIKVLLSALPNKVIETYTYSPSGRELVYDYWNTLLPTSKAKNPWRYQNLRIDEETGLLYTPKGYYDPARKENLWANP